MLKCQGNFCNLTSSEASFYHSKFSEKLAISFRIIRSVYQHGFAIKSLLKKSKSKNVNFYPWRVMRKKKENRWSVDPTTTPGYSLKETLSNGSKKQNPGRAAQSHLSWGARAESPRTRVPNLQDLMPDYLRWSRCNNNRNKMHNKCNVELLGPDILEWEVKWVVFIQSTMRSYWMILSWNPGDQICILISSEELLSCQEWMRGEQ